MALQDLGVSHLCPHPLPCCSPLSYHHWFPSPPLWCLLGSLLNVWDALANTSEDGAADYQQEMNMEPLLQQQRGIPAKLSTCSGLSIYGMGLGRNKCPGPFWVIRGRLDTGLGPHPRDRVELGCVSTILRREPETRSLGQSRSDTRRAWLGAREGQNQTV